MIFDNPYALFGLLAVLLPLAVAFLVRAKPVPIKWGAMRILEKAVRKTKNRFRIQDILLLLVRMILIAGVVLALASPSIELRSGKPLSEISSETPLRILLVDGSDSGRRLLEELDPYSLDDLAANYIEWGLDDSALQVKRIRSGELEQELFENFEVLILSDISMLSETESEKISGFLDRGGGLLVFFGTRTRIEEWNSGFLTDCFTGVRLEPIRRIKPGQKLDPHSYRSDILKAFENYPGSGLEELPQRYVFPLKPREMNSNVLSYENGEPLIADVSGYLREGQGLSRAIFVTGAPEMSIGSVPARPIFLPLVRELVSALSPERIAQLNSPKTHVSLSCWFLVFALILLSLETRLSHARNHVTYHRLERTMTKT